MRRGGLIHDCIQICAQVLEVDARRPGEYGGDDIGGDEPLVPYRMQLPHWNAVPGHYERLTAVKRPHDRAALISELSLSDPSRHGRSVALVLHRTLP
jgi:hypothetical protein